MPQDASARFLEAERAELERVASALDRWPRLSHLLTYMGEKLSVGDADQLNEYNIATEVLGRSKTVFNAAEDAIARVETHRLRERLAEFYENEGRSHPIQVTLPPGSYVPIFIHKPEGAPSHVSPDLLMSAPALPADKTRLPAGGVRWKYWIVAAVLLIGVGAYLLFRTGEFSAREKTADNQVATAASLLIPSGPSSSAVRLIAGYSGPPRTDSAGLVWNPDEYFSAGGVWQRSPGFIARTSDPFLFERSRTGDFSYSIPLRPGSYELYLFFSTPVRSDEALSTFNVSMLGKWLLQGFDINADALGENVADERVFRDVSPEKDGFLHIGFSGATGPPTLNAIEVLPGVPHAQLPVRLIMQTTPLTDRKGQFWRPDNYFIHGRLSSEAHTLLDSPDPDLFSSERWLARLWYHWNSDWGRTTPIVRREYGPEWNQLNHEPLFHSAESAFGSQYSKQRVLPGHPQLHFDAGAGLQSGVGSAGRSIRQPQLLCPAILASVHIHQFRSR